MFYTFGDYRDLCLDTDISASNEPVKTVKDNIKNVFNTNNGLVKGSDKEKREKFWKDHKDAIWKGMLCALEKASGTTGTLTGPTSIYTYSTVKFSGDKSPTLETFAQTPQFLRWFTEWSDDFCKQRKEQLDQLVNVCKECNVSDSVISSGNKTCNDKEKCDACKKECTQYENWLQKWKDQYKTQSKKYSADKDNDPYKSIGEVQNSTHAYEYLYKQLKHFTCENGDCKCMQEKSNKPSTDGNTDSMPASLEYPPKEINGKCDCQEKEAPPAKVPEVPKQTTKSLDVFEIVKTLFTTTNTLQEACKTKYDGKYYGWKCVSSGDSTTTSSGSGATTTGDKGAICVPPRRRRLYVGKLTQWAEEATKSLSPPDPTPATSSRAQSHPLLTAFVESAAVETFFLWDRYKKENTKKPEKKKDQSELQGGVLLFPELDDEEDIAIEPDPEEELKTGIIPDDFLRQMFYTFGDYRDLCVGVKDDVAEALKASGDKNIDKIEQKIKSVIENSGSKPSVEKTTPEDWWQKNGEHIWNGMICALTYTDSGEKPTQDGEVKKALWDKEGTSNEPISQYQYKTVELKEDSGGPKGNDDPNSQPLTLKNFVKRPPYFRYLEEWGQNFCKERKKRLEKIKEDCYKDGGITKQYSGDGEECSNIDVNKDKIFADLEGPSCAISCSSYRKWIKGKKTQYEKQEKIYSKQKTDAKNNNGFSKTLEEDAAKFLERLASCSKTNSGEGKKFFENEGEAFRPATDCDPCSEFTVKLEKCNCRESAKGKGCNGGKMNADDIKNKTDVNGNIDMLVSDDSTAGFHDLTNCVSANIFKGIKENKWKCGEICGYNVCGLKKGDNNDIDDKQIILIRAFLKRWLEYFFEDYNKIKKKLNVCIENGNGSTCINECDKKCNCVEQWINKKKKEWQQIRDHYLKQYKSEDPDDYNMRSFLETWIPKIAVVNDQDNVIKLSKFDKSCGCSASVNEQNKNGYQDAIGCMLNKLQNKIEECKQKHAPTSDNSCSTLDNTTPSLEDDDYIPLEETEDVKAPNICPTQPKETKKEEEDD
ncbi:hypothetical protein PFMALIP_06007, partial [Plasmodium falciparum MaliPS096_E11]